MSVEKESDPSSPLGDVAEEEKEFEDRSDEISPGQYSLTITRNYKNKTHRVEISKILQELDPVPTDSQSPVATLVRHSKCPGGGTEVRVAEEAEKPAGAEFELTIKSNNSVIKIRGFNNESTISFDTDTCPGESIYDFLSKEVDKIFKRPEKEEIERAMKAVTSGERTARKPKSAPKQKKNTWKALTKTLINVRGSKPKDQRRGSLERYPKIVLLNDPETTAEDEKRPKTAGGDKRAAKKETEVQTCEAKLDLEKKHQLGGKIIDETETNDMNLSTEELFLKEMNIIAEERLCVELEKQLLGEEMDLLRKEKHLLKKERSLLGEELNVFQEEKPEEKRDPEERVPSDILRKQRQKLLGSQRQERRCFTTDREHFYSSVPTIFPLHDRHSCPSLYLPSYDRPVPYYSCVDFCCGRGRAEHPAPQNHASTQTEPVEVDSNVEGPRNLDLPLGILSDLFPRIVVMKSFQEEASGEESDPKVLEISQTDDPIPEVEKEDETGCDESQRQLEETDEREMSGEGGENSSEADDEQATLEPVQTVEESKDLPLTRIGHSIYEKLKELAVKRGQSQKEDEVETTNGKETENLQTSFRISIGSGNEHTELTVHNGEASVDVREADPANKALVRRSELWYAPDGGTPRGKSHALPPNIDPDSSGGLPVSDAKRALSFTVSSSGGMVLTVAMEAKNGAEADSNGVGLLGEDRAFNRGMNDANLSPRTGEALKTLKERLERTELSGTDDKSKGVRFPGLFLIKPVDPKKTFPKDDYSIIKERKRKRGRSAGKAREYYCEECLATMRLLEDEELSVRSIVDKFETIIQLGSY